MNAEKIISRNLASLKELSFEISNLVNSDIDNLDKRTKKAVVIDMQTLNKKIKNAENILKKKEENYILDLKIELAEHLASSWIPSFEEEVINKIRKNEKAGKCFEKIKKITAEMMEIMQ